MRTARLDDLRARARPEVARRPLLLVASAPLMRLRSSIVVMLLFRSAAHGSTLGPRHPVPRVEQRLPVCMQAGGAERLRPRQRVCDHAAIELKWQRHGTSSGRLRAPAAREGQAAGVLDMFSSRRAPGCTSATRRATRDGHHGAYWRMRDFDVLHPMGWDLYSGCPPSSTRSTRGRTSP